MTYRFLIFLLLAISNITYAMEKDNKELDNLFFSDSMPIELQQILLEYVLHSKLRVCRTYQDFKKFKIFINSINKSTSNIFQEILNANSQRLINCKNINYAQDFKLLSFFMIEKNLSEYKKKLKDILFHYDINLNARVDLYLLMQADLNNSWINSKSTDLQSGYSKVINLFKYICSLNQKLVIAVHNNDVDSVQRLLKAGANPNLVTRHNILIENKPVQISVRLLIIAINKQKLELVKALLNAGARVNFYYHTPYYKKRTPLYYATQWGNKNIVKELIRAGADLNAICQNRNTPLIMASYFGHVKVVKELLKAGSDRSLRNDVGFNAYMYAAYNKHRAEIESLLDPDRKLFEFLNDFKEMMLAECTIL